MIAGKYQIKPPLPFTPGGEAAGIVTEVAPDVRTVKPGDRVITRSRFGGYAEETVVPAALCSPLPEGWSFAEGAAFFFGTIPPTTC